MSGEEEIQLTLGSICDGIGGFPEAARRNGIIAVWASEIEEFPKTISSRHFPKMKHLGDVTKISGAEIEPVDIIAFGSPCQDLSIAGKQKGIIFTGKYIPTKGVRSIKKSDRETSGFRRYLINTRSGVLLECIRVVREMREATGGKYPRFVIWENVPGALSSNYGRDFRTFLEKMLETEIPIPQSSRKIKTKSGKLELKITWANAGMVRGNGRSLAWRILDAQYWGVAQRRRRIYSVTDLGGQCAGEILFEFAGVSGDTQESGKEREEAAGTSGSGIKTTGRVDCTRGGIAGTVSAKWAKGTGGPAGMASETDLIVLHPIAIREREGCSGGGKVPLINHTTYICEPIVGFPEVANTLLAKGNLSYRSDMDNLVYTVDCRNLVENEELSGTLQAKDGGGYSLNYVNPVRIGYTVRRLTPKECERLQDLEDNWTSGGSDSKRYKAIGNGLAICCPTWIFKQIKEVLRRERDIEVI